MNSDSLFSSQWWRRNLHVMTTVFKRRIIEGRLLKERLPRRKMGEMLQRRRSSRLRGKAEKRNHLSFLYQLVFATQQTTVQWLWTGNIYYCLSPSQSFGEISWPVLWARLTHAGHQGAGVCHLGAGWGWPHSRVYGGLAVPGQWIDWTMYLPLPCRLAWASMRVAADFQVSGSAENLWRLGMGPPSLLLHAYWPK